MKSGADAMSKIRQNIAPESVDEVMDDIREEMETANEISEAIGRPVDDVGLEEEDLLGELNMLEEEDLESKLLDPPKVEDVVDDKMPSAPIGGLQDDEEEELKNLEASLAVGM